MSVSSGYVRDGDQRPNDQAVRWWFLAEIDGVPFSRGGRVATARLARQALERARAEFAAEGQRIAELKRPALWLHKDGSMTPIQRTGPVA